MQNPRKRINNLTYAFFGAMIPSLFGISWGFIFTSIVGLPILVALIVTYKKSWKDLQAEALARSAKKGLNVSPEAQARRKRFSIILYSIFGVGFIAFIVGPAIDQPAICLSIFIISIFATFFGGIGMSVADHAEKKGKSWETFFWLSVLVSPVLTGIIVAVISADQSKVVAGTKKCPKCAEVVKEEAILCKHCGSDLS